MKGKLCMDLGGAFHKVELQCDPRVMKVSKRSREV